MIRKRLKWLALALGGVVLADCALWTWGTARLHDRWLQLAHDAAERGWHLEAARVTRAGWPLAARLALEAPAISAPGGPRWTAERGVIGVSLLDPAALHGAVQGWQRASAPGLPPLAWRADRFEVRLAGGGAQLRAADLAAGEAGRAPVLRAAGLDLSVAPAPDAARIGVTADGVRLGGDPAPAALSLQAEVTGLAARTGPLAVQARGWRAAGGALRLERLHASLGEAVVDGAGVARLDDALQPDAAATLRVTGADALVRRLEQAGFVRPEAALAVRTVAALASALTDRVTVRLTLAAGVASADGIPLGRVPPLRWPAERFPPRAHPVCCRQG
jgi:hypothetical protein